MIEELSEQCSGTPNVQDFIRVYNQLLAQGRLETAPKPADAPAFDQRPETAIGYHNDTFMTSKDGRKWTHAQVDAMSSADYAYLFLDGKPDQTSVRFE